MVKKVASQTIKSTYLRSIWLKICLLTINRSENVAVFDRGLVFGEANGKVEIGGVYNKAIQLVQYKLSS